MKPWACHHFGIIEVASVDYDRVFEFLPNAGKVEIGEFFPLGEDEQSVSAMSSFIGGAGKDNGRRENFARAIHGCRIVGTDLAALLQKRLNEH